MSRIECKAGDKVVLYRKDDCYPHLKVGEDIFTIVNGDLPFPVGRIAGDKSEYPQNYCLKPTSLSHLRKTDKGARVVIIRADGLPFWHRFNINSVVTITGVKSKWKGEDIYDARDDHEYTQWLHPSQFKLAKEQ